MKAENESAAPAGTEDDLAKHAAALLHAIEQEPVPPAIRDLAHKLQAAIDKRWRPDAE